MPNPAGLNWNKGIKLGNLQPSLHNFNWNPIKTQHRIWYSLGFLQSLKGWVTEIMIKSCNWKPNFTTYCKGTWLDKPTPDKTAISQSFSTIARASWNQKLLPQILSWGIIKAQRTLGPELNWGPTFVCLKCEGFTKKINMRPHLTLNNPFPQFLDTNILHSSHPIPPDLIRNISKNSVRLLSFPV